MHGGLYENILLNLQITKSYKRANISQKKKKQKKTRESEMYRYATDK